MSRDFDEKCINEIVNQLHLRCVFYGEAALKKHNTIYPIGEMYHISKNTASNFDFLELGKSEMWEEFCSAGFLDTKETRYLDILETLIVLAVLSDGYPYLPSALLALAASYGQVDIAEYFLLIFSQHLNHLNMEHSLHLAAKYGHLTMVKYFSNLGVDIHSGQEKAFRVSSRNGHLHVAEWLIENNSDPNVYEDDAFIHASENGHIDVIEFLADFTDNQTVSDGLQAARDSTAHGSITAKDALQILERISEDRELRALALEIKGSSGVRKRI